MTTESTIEAVRCFMAAFNAYQVQEPETLNLMTDDVYWMDPRFPAFRGKAQLAKYFQYAEVENGLIKPVWEAKSIFATDEEACVEWTSEATLGVRVTIEGTSVFRVRDGKIYYYRGYWDTFFWKNRLNFILSDSMMGLLSKMGFGGRK